METKRPVVLNGIAVVATRPDLIDRVIHVSMPVIPATARKDDADTHDAWERDRPLVFGALLDLRMTAAIVLIILGALAFGHWITDAGVAQRLVELVSSKGMEPWQFLALINLLLLILGMFLEVIAVILITVPLVLPLLEPMGINPIHFAMVITINMELALLTPPVGLNLFVLSSITRAPVERVARGVLPFVLLMIGLLMLVTYVPEISLFLPNLVYGN